MRVQTERAIFWWAAITFLVLFWTGLILWAASSIASPFLVCNPQAGVVGYEIEGLGFGQSTGAEADGSLRLDLAPLTTSGDYSIKVKACNFPWGCSDATPFSFTRPPNPSSPVNIRLEP